MAILHFKIKKNKVFDKKIIFVEKQKKLHENYIKPNELKSFHPAINEMSIKKSLKSKFMIKLNSEVLVAYIKKHNLKAIEFCNYTDLGYGTYERLCLTDCKYIYGLYSLTVKKICDSLYNNVDEEFQIEIKMLLPDHWQYFVKSNNIVTEDK
tara:strand:- start:50 stop:505 length:456 start_codon:yes stop_codon:yes gene_type:complete